MQSSFNERFKWAQPPVKGIGLFTLIILLRDQVWDPKLAGSSWA